MNIEEKDIGAAIRKAGPHVFHFHTCENDRGTPGSGHVEWNSVKDALDAISYPGPVVIESFTTEIKEPSCPGYQRNYYQPSELR